MKFKKIVKDLCLCMFNNNCLTVLFLFFCISYSYGQSKFTITGNAKLENQSSFSQINVSLINSKDTTLKYSSAVIDDRGFSVELVGGVYNLVVSHIGYASFRSQVIISTDTNLPVITLYPVTKDLDEILVTKSYISFKPNGYVADISLNLKLKQLTLDNILLLIPGTNVINNSISVFNKQVQKVYLNGRELHLSGSDLINFIASLEGKQVKNIEVVSNSGSEEDGKNMGAAMLKITTHKIDDGGTLSMNVSSNNNKYKHFNTSGVNYQYRLNRWSIYAIVNYNQGDFRTLSSNNYDLINNIKNTSSESDATREVVNLNGIYGVNYEINKKNNIGFEGNFRGGQQDNFTNVNSSLFENNYTTSLSSIGSMKTNQKPKRNAQSINYTYRGDNSNFKIFIDRLSDRITGVDNNLYSYTNNDKQGFDKGFTNNNTIYTARVDYEKSLKGNQTLNIGAKYTDINIINDAHFSITNQLKDSVFFNQFNYREHVWAGYAKYGFSYKKLKTILGGRVEHVNFNSGLNDIANNNESSFTYFLPEVSITLDMSKYLKFSSFSLNYNQRIYRPSLDELNPNISQDNQFVSTQGNPNLKPYYGSSLDSRFVILNKYIINNSFSWSKDGRIQFSQVDTDSKEVISWTENGLYTRNWNTYLEAPLVIGKSVDIKLNTGYANIYMKNRDENINYSIWNFGLNSFARLPFKINMISSFIYQLPFRNLYTENRMRVNAFINFNKSFLKNSLNTSIQLIDIFNTQGKLINKSFYPTYSSVNRNNYSNLSITARVSYTFKWGNKSARINKSGAGNSDEENRLKQN